MFVFSWAETVGCEFLVLLGFFYGVINDVFAGSWGFGGVVVVVDVFRVVTIRRLFAAFGKPKTGVDAALHVIRGLVLGHVGDHFLKKGDVLFFETFLESLQGGEETVVNGNDW